MAKAASARRDHGAGRGELRAWYVERLRPRLTEAAKAGTIEPAAAHALDRQMGGLLDLAVDDRSVSAPPDRAAA